MRTTPTICLNLLLDNRLDHIQHVITKFLILIEHVHIIDTILITVLLIVDILQITRFQLVAVVIDLVFDVV